MAMHTHIQQYYTTHHRADRKERPLITTTTTTTTKKKNRNTKTMMRSSSRSAITTAPVNNNNNNNKIAFEFVVVVFGLTLLLLLLATSSSSSQKFVPLVVHAQSVPPESQPQPPLLWSSTGGGWRAMFADIGFANAFQQAGLFADTSSSATASTATTTTTNDDESNGESSTTTTNTTTTRTRFTSIATTSGGSWFSTQLFYSQNFYDKTVLAPSPSDVRQFVLDWMETYASISQPTDDEIVSSCDMSELQDSRIDVDDDVIETFQDVCYLVVKYDYDWALFITEMLDAAAKGSFDDPAFIDQLAIPSRRIDPLNGTDLLIQSTLVPNSRVRNETNIDGDGVSVYLGYKSEESDSSGSSSSSSSSPSSSDLFTVVLSAAWVVQSTSAKFVYGYEDLTSNLQAYYTSTPADHSWDTWQDFYLYPTRDGTITIPTTQIGAMTAGGSLVNGTTSTGSISDMSSSSSSSSIGITTSSSNAGSPLRVPFGGNDNVTVAQVASISSAAAGSGSPRVSSVYTQMFSIPHHEINEYTVKTVWRVLAGIAVAASASMFFFGICVWFGHYECRIFKTEQKAHMVGIITGTCCGILLGIVTAVVWGIGSVVIPKGYNNGVNSFYRNATYDNMAVCTQWPNPCGLQDGFFIDGWFVDNPAFVINVAHEQQRQLHQLEQLQQQQQQLMEAVTAAAAARNITAANSTAPPKLKLEPFKAVITNTNEEWDTEWNRAQFLQYFSTYFNENVPPGGFLWGPGFFAPYRSPQIFEEYLDPDGIDALLEPIEGTNLTTALLTGTTVNNSAFGVVEGQTVNILLLNTNAPITTYVVGLSQIEALSEPLAEMAAEIAGSEELVRRVRDFVFS